MKFPASENPLLKIAPKKITPQKINPKRIVVYESFTPRLPDWPAEKTIIN